jgi:hypothetical protein
MTPSKPVLVLLTLLILFSGLSAGPSLFQSGQNEEYFPETGHFVRGEFLDFYRKSADPLLLFGYPLTEPIDHPIRQGVKIQFFQRARLELDTNNRAAGVQLYAIGEWLYDNTQRGNKANFATSAGACRQFPKNDKLVCYAFLQFYDAHNGAFYFGEPISDVELQDNRLVQYFERARMEWRPESEPGKRVALTDLGRLNFDILIGDPVLINPVFIGQSFLSQIQVHAFVDRPLLASGERQTIFVIVRDQFASPVQGALVMVSVISPDGRVDNYRPDSVTNEDGLVKIEFPVENLKPNQVVKVVARSNVVNGPEGQAETMFRIWW